MNKTETFSSRKGFLLDLKIKTQINQFNWIVLIDPSKSINEPGQSTLLNTQLGTKKNFFLITFTEIIYQPIIRLWKSTNIFVVKFWIGF